MLGIIFIRILPFVLTFAVGAFAVNIIEISNDNESPRDTSRLQAKPRMIVPTKIVGSGSSSGLESGRGTASCSQFGKNEGGAQPARKIGKLQILSKPKAAYTDAARSNGIEGHVRLKVMLLASGQVGSIVPVSKLPYGLTEQAIAAARKIRFEPKKVDGVPVTTTVTFDYGFNIY